MSNIKCIIVDDEPIAREVMQLLVAQIADIEIIAICKNANEARNTLHEKEIDLMFLDINMPEVSGISLARASSKSVKIIFTTAYREYAIDGFELQAVDYLLKPISLSRLEQAINKYRQENKIATNIEEYILIRSERKMVKINQSDIVYIESLSDYLKIHTTDRTLITRETISNMQGMLPKRYFVRIHRSFIVSRALVNSYTSEYVEINRIKLPISRSYRRAFIEEMESMNKQL